MTKSIYTKLVAIILVLILALMAVVGAFLMQGVRNFYISEFYSRMQEVFGKADLAQDLRAAADAPELTPNASERQRHGADGQARHDVLEELVGIIAGKFGAKIAEKGRKHTHSPRAIPQHGTGAVCIKRRGFHCAVLP